MNSQIITVLAGVSSALGFLSLLAYFYLISQFRRAERSVRETVEGEGLFNATQVLEILRQFSDDRSRLEALVHLTSLDQSKATALLQKIKSGVDVSQLQRLTYRHYIGWAGLVGGVLILLGLLGLGAKKNLSSVPAECLPFGRLLDGPTAGCDCGTASVSIIPWTGDSSSLRSDVQGEVRGASGREIGIQFEAVPLCQGQSIRASESYIDWGDGSGRETLGDILSGCFTHTYKSAGYFDVRVRLSLECYDFGPEECAKRCIADGYLKARISEAEAGLGKSEARPLT